MEGGNKRNIKRVHFARCLIVYAIPAYVLEQYSRNFVLFFSHLDSCFPALSPCIMCCTFEILKE